MDTNHVSRILVLSDRKRQQPVRCLYRHDGWTVHVGSHRLSDRRPIHCRVLDGPQWSWRRNVSHSVSRSLPVELWSMGCAVADSEQGRHVNCLEWSEYGTGRSMLIVSIALHSYG